MPLYNPPTPSGLMATPATSSTSDTSITAEKLQLSYSFTAVAGRSYHIIYNEPSYIGTVATTAIARIRESTSAFGITGTVVQTANQQTPTLTFNQIRCEFIYVAPTSGVVYFVATLAVAAGTLTATRFAGTSPYAGKQPQFYALNVGVL